MSQRITFLAVGKPGEINNVTRRMGWILDLLEHDKGGLRVDGCGFDAGHQCVYELGVILHNDGNASKHEWMTDLEGSCANARQRA